MNTVKDLEQQNTVSEAKQNMMSEAKQISNLKSDIDNLDRRIEFLLDNAFKDRCRIGELENEVEELTDKIIRLECK